MTDKIKYQFQLQEKTLEFEVNLERQSKQPEEDSEIEWTRLEYNQCPQCPLKSKSHSTCPVAVDVKEIIADFSELLSYDMVDITVIAQEREYRKNCDVQTGLKALLGLVMATSNCPTLSVFRGMARFHLPFSSLEDTVTRTVSFYLLKKYYAYSEGNPVDFSLDGLKETYKALEDVNTAFLKRIRQAVKFDANLNAVLNLHADSTILTRDLEEILDEIKPFIIPQELEEKEKKSS